MSCRIPICTFDAKRMSSKFRPDDETGNVPTTALASLQGVQERYLGTGSYRPGCGLVFVLTQAGSMGECKAYSRKARTHFFHFIRHLLYSYFMV